MQLVLDGADGLPLGKLFSTLDELDLVLERLVLTLKHLQVQLTSVKLKP